MYLKKAHNLREIQPAIRRMGAIYSSLAAEAQREAEVWRSGSQQTKHTYNTRPPSRAVPVSVPLACLSLFWRALFLLLLSRARSLSRFLRNVSYGDVFGTKNIIAAPLTLSPANGRSHKY